MSEDIKKILEEKDKIYQRVLDLLERKAKVLRGGQLKTNITMTLEQAMNDSFDRIRSYSNKRTTNAIIF